MIATGGFLHVLPSSYRPASAPVTHTVMIPVDSISLFVGFTGAADLTESGGIIEHPCSTSSLYGIATPDQIYTATLPITRGDYSENDAALQEDADSTTPASNAKSIAPVSNPGDFEDSSIRPLFDSDSESESAEFPRGRSTRHAAVLVVDAAGGNQPPDPFSTPIAPTAMAGKLETFCLALEAQQKKEREERRKFELERQQELEITQYRQRRIRE
jgi:hypothetical protein